MFSILINDNYKNDDNRPNNNKILTIINYE